MIYLDNAATSFPKPPAVIRAMVYAQQCIGASPGRGGSLKTVKAGELVFKTRAALSQMFCCKEENVIFTSNCTEALNTAIKGVVKKGDEIIISSLEHNSVLRPVHALKIHGIADYRVAHIYPSDDEKTVAGIEKLINEKTRALVCTLRSNVFGTTLPFEKIGKLCNEKNILFIADAAQYAGSERLNMKKAFIDILCLPGHKGLLGPMGTGALLLGKDIDLTPLTEGGTGSLSLSPLQPAMLPDRLESGTLNLPGIAGLYEGIRFLNSAAAAGEKEELLCRILSEDLSSIRGIKLYKELRGTKRTNIVPFNIKSFHSEEISAKLDKEGFHVRSGYHCSFLAHNSYGTDKKGVIRISPGIFNTKKDIKTLINCINKIAKS